MSSTPISDKPICDIEGDDILFSLASCANIVIGNMHNEIRNRWFKIPCFLLLNGLLLVAVPILALAEATLRFALAIITSPLFLTDLFLTKEEGIYPIAFAVTGYYSLTQILNAFYTTYLTFTSNEKIDAKDNGLDIAINMGVNIEDLVF